MTPDLANAILADSTAWKDARSLLLLAYRAAKADERRVIEQHEQPEAA